MEVKRIVASFIALVGACSLVVSCSPQVATPSSPESAAATSPEDTASAQTPASTEPAEGVVLAELVASIMNSDINRHPDLAQQLQAYGPAAVTAVQQQIDSVSSAAFPGGLMSVAELIAALTDDQRSQLDLTATPLTGSLPAYYWYITRKFLGDTPTPDTPDAVAGALFDMLAPAASDDGVQLAAQIVGKLWPKATLKQAKQMGLGLRQLIDTVWADKTATSDQLFQLSDAAGYTMNSTAQDEDLIWASFGPAYLDLSLRYGFSDSQFLMLSRDKANGWFDFWSGLADVQRTRLQDGDPASSIYLPPSVGSQAMDKLAAKKWPSGGAKPKPGGWLLVYDDGGASDYDISDELAVWKPSAKQVATAAYDSASLRIMVVYKVWYEDVRSHYSNLSSSGNLVDSVSRCNITLTGVNMASKAMFYQKTFKPPLPSKLDVQTKTYQGYGDFRSADIGCLDSDADQAMIKLLNTLT